MAKSGCLLCDVFRPLLQLFCSAFATMPFVDNPLWTRLPIRSISSRSGGWMEKAQAAWARALSIVALIEPGKSGLPKSRLAFGKMGSGTTHQWCWLRCKKPRDVTKVPAASPRMMVKQVPTGWNRSAPKGWSEQVGDNWCAQTDWPEQSGWHKSGPGRTAQTRSRTSRP